MTSREEVLQRITRAGAESSIATRAACKTTSRSRKAIIDQFSDYAADYKATVQRVSEAQLPGVIQELAGDGGMVVPTDLPASWLGGLKAIADAPLSHAELDRCSAVVSGCAVAIAETGTIVLDAGFAQGRRAISLIPDHHICVVFSGQIVDGVDEAVAILRPAVFEGRPLTWISGPSATSDIELTRVEGVHGPRRLDILVVEGYTKSPGN